MVRLHRNGRRGLKLTGLAMGAIILAAPLAPIPASAAGITNVATYHGDTLRTGWNDDETILTPANVGAAGFGLLQSVALDEQVDAQPLIVGNVTIGQNSPTTVVYAATENNSVYAIDANSGTVLLSVNLGTQVPIASLPGGCWNASAGIGINSTPVIDVASSTIYVVADTYVSGNAVFYLHPLDLDTLQDKAGSPVEITASHKLSDGTVFNFTPDSSRQRAALLEAKGNVYAAFTSYCDFNANTSRGWVLGWKAATLKPLPKAELTNKFDTKQAPNNYFLSTIWMSGAGVAADASGDLFFVTGNTDYRLGGSTKFSTENLGESVVKLSANLQGLKSYFTPEDYAALDAKDGDFGSGGILLLPDQTGKTKHLAVAAGKDGNMYLLNRNSLGGMKAGGPNRVLGTYQIGGCACIESYFVGADRVSRVVSSGGTALMTWKVETSPAALVLDQQSGNLSSGQATGMMTTVSSNEETAGTAIIWAVTRPLKATPPENVLLYAFDPTNMASPLFSGIAGTWPVAGANANIVPTVANGKVYVASYKNLDIFGLGASPTVAPHVVPAVTEVVLPGNQLFGTVAAVEGTVISLKTRTGQTVAVEAGDAIATHKSVMFPPGSHLLVRGSYTADGALHATAVQHAKDSPDSWGPDK